ncbi:unnamed protein product [Parajaminaea phylloscopi]
MTTKKRPGSPGASASPAHERGSKRAKVDTAETQAGPSSIKSVQSVDQLDGKERSATTDMRTLCTKHYAKQREAVLLRLSGNVTSRQDDLVCLDEQADALLRTLRATVQKGEGNTMLLIGPRGSGKSAILQTTLSALSSSSHSHSSPPFHHVYLSAKTCPTDRLAMRELARQLIQLGALTLSEGDSTTLGLDEDDEAEDEGEQDEDDGPDIAAEQGEERDDDTPAGQRRPGADDDADHERAALGATVLSSMANTTSSILSMLAATPSAATGSKAKPLIITLDFFELLTSRPRQALLYCLFDAVQSGTYRPGLAVVGMTRQPDTVDLLEKRVKSRFSHRTIHCYPPGTTDDWLRLVKGVLRIRAPVQPVGDDDGDDDGEKNARAALEVFSAAWKEECQSLLSHEAFRRMITRIVDLSRDVQLLFQILYLPLANLDPTRPALVVDDFLASERSFRKDWVRDVLLYDLPTLPFLLLIASKHLQTRDRAVFNFEMAFEEVAQFGRRSRRNREGAGTGGLGLKADQGSTSVSMSPLASPYRLGRSRGTTSSSSPSAAAAAAASTLDLKARAPPPSDWEDRDRALIAFEQLLSLEIFLPDAFLSSLSYGPTSLTAGNRGSGGAAAAAAAAATTASSPASTDRSVVITSSTSSSVRREYLRVRSILDAATIVHVAKARSKRGTLTTDVAQWATRAG